MLHGSHYRVHVMRRSIRHAADEVVAQTTPLALSVPCQDCGAKLQFEPGIVSKPCEFCGTINVAPSHVAAPMVRWESDNARRAEEELERSAKEGETALAQAVARSNRLVLVGRCVVAIAPAAVMFSLGNAFIGDNSRADEHGGWFLIGLGVVWLLAVGLRFAFRKRRA